MARLDPETLAAFNATRNRSDHRNVCNAPFSNMYFAIDGRVGACWLSFAHAPTWPQHSIREIWFGAFFEALRDNIRKQDLSLYPGCTVCERNLRSGNYQGTLAAAYDTLSPPKEYPTIMEFELSNRCNLECVMCRGELSSSIRKNRDGKPPLPIPYDERFVDQLEEFLPHLVEARFNGGEPLLQPIFYRIAQRVAEVNPAIEITIATNGTVWNKRVRETLERGRFRVNVSIDGYSQQVFESLRVNARHEIVWRNAGYFADYCRRRCTIFSVMINPMRQNWWELPDLVEWCNRSGYHLAFNTVIRPEHYALVSWDAENLEQVYTSLRARSFAIGEDPALADLRLSNVTKYQNFVENQVGAWWAAKRNNEKFFPRYYGV